MNSPSHTPVEETADRTLYIMRHAKSDWSDPSLPDYERPLNDRGLRDAPVMGRVLVGRGVIPSLIISSPAVRALSTAKIIAGKIGYEEDKIAVDERIYRASVGELVALIQKTDDACSSLMLVGHNPAFTELAGYLTGTAFHNIPTCGVVAVKFSCDSWKKTGSGAGKVLFYEYPKKYR